MSIAAFRLSGFGLTYPSLSIKELTSFRTIRRFCRIFERSGGDDEEVEPPEDEIFTVSSGSSTQNLFTIS